VTNYQITPQWLDRLTMRSFKGADYRGMPVIDFVFALATAAKQRTELSRKSGASFGGSSLMG
jgi:hypothetical protein